MIDGTREEAANDRAGTPGPRWSKRRIALVFFLLVLTLAGYNFFVDCDPPVVPELVLPSGTNGWDTLVEARELFPTDVEPIEYVPDEEEPTYTELMTLTDYDTEIALRPEHRAIVETWLANVDEIEARIDLALSHDVIRRPNGSTHPRVISVSKDLSRWLVLRAHLAAEGGEPSEVIRQVERVHSMSDKSLESHPDLFTFFAANTLKSVASRTLEGLLPVDDEAVLRKALRLVQESASTRTQLLRAVTGDYAESGEWLPHGENTALEFRKVSPILLSLLYRENRTRRMYWARLLRVADAWEDPDSYLREERDGPLHTVSAWLCGNHFGLEWMRQAAGADQFVLKDLRSTRLRNGAIELALAARIRTLKTGSTPATLEELEQSPHTRNLLERGEYRFEPESRTIFYDFNRWDDPVEIRF